MSDDPKEKILWEIHEIRSPLFPCLEIVVTLISEFTLGQRTGQLETGVLVWKFIKNLICKMEKEKADISVSTALLK